MTKEINDDLKNAGIFELKYYYKKIPVVGNIFTVCALFSENKEMLARGVCICSLLDSHNKKTARKLSRDRALNAFFNQTNSLDILKDPLGCAASNFETLAKTIQYKDEKECKQIIKDVEEIGFEITYNNLEYKKITFLIPYGYPMTVTKQHFNYKSEYKPVPTEDEKKIFRMDGK